MAFKYVFGPVPSRRLGRSLGVNPIPFKVCNYSCVYCQLGRTRRMGNRRRAFFGPDEMLDEIRQALDLYACQVDYVTFVGEGEPTLCTDLGDLIDRTKEMTDLPVAVITNGSLLYREDVRRDLEAADVVMPSLDATDAETFRKINRPYGGLDIEAVLNGMVEFRKGYSGQLWVEVMLVRGVNDGEGSLLDLRRALDQIGPDRVYVNVPTRPPAEAWVEPPDANGLARAHALLGEAVFIDFPEAGLFGTAGFGDPVEAVLMIVRRHPMRRRQIVQTLRAFTPEKVDVALEDLEREGQLQKVEYRGEMYYTTGEGRFAGRSRE